MIRNKKDGRKNIPLSSATGDCLNILGVVQETHELSSGNHSMRES